MVATWILVFTPEQKPWLLTKLEPGVGLSQPQPPQALRDHIEREHGPFDGTAMFPSQSLRGEWIDWPD